MHLLYPVVPVGFVPVNLSCRCLKVIQQLVSHKRIHQGHVSAIECSSDAAGANPSNMWNTLKHIETHGGWKKSIELPKKHPIPSGKLT